MPRITLPLSVSYEAITRPVGMAIARDVMRVCAIPEDTPIFMPGEWGSGNQPGSTLNSPTEGEVRFESFRHVTCTLDDTVRNASVMEQIVRSNEFPPMIEDRALGISIRPVYVQSDISLSFKYVCATRQEAQKWIDDFVTRRAENRTAIAHDVEYTIPIQDGVLSLLSYLHSLREKIAGYGDDFVTWFKSIQCRQFTTLSALDIDPNKFLLSVPEKQAQLTGWFDFTDVPKEQKVDGNVTWEIEWQYKVMYNRCVKLYITYPLMVHQTHVNKNFYSSKPRFGIEELDKRGAIGITALDFMDGHVGNYPAPAGGLRIPTYDDWIAAPRAQPSYSVPAISWMIALDPTDPQDILNLNTLPEFRWTPEVEAYLKANHATLHIKSRQACFFTLFIGDVAMDPSLLTIDEDLNVRSTRPLDLRYSYHLRLSFGTRYSEFMDSAVSGMQTSPIAVLQIFQSILPTLDVVNARSKLLAGKYLTTEYIQWFYKHLQDHLIGVANPAPGGVGVENGLLPFDDGLPSTGIYPWGNRRRTVKYVQYLAIVSKTKTIAA